ncbi:hypothetical protein D9756_000398 [Leucocoprinus leucothites]|uniref:Uncharacterized protein n=1 Tax=Leucocoprinus leucothites TaxID=201217 RepID=A0A8H5LNV4_9AGAR|nr:hypothetical protein D9756_000398 [Leucoagaricus leucothites]
MKIEWASNFTPDGRRRTPPPSTIHGWLAKWRGTLSGNEVLRSRGMAEMRKAAAHRRARRNYELKKAAKSGQTTFGILSLLRGKGTRNRLSGRSRTQSGRSRPKGTHTSRRPTTRKPDSKASRNAGQKRLPPRSNPKSKPQQGSSRRPAHSRN